MSVNIADNPQRNVNAAAVTVSIPVPPKFTANIFKDIGIAAEDVAHWLAAAVKWVAGIAAKVKDVVAAEKTITPEFVAGIEKIFNDLEEVIADVATAAAGDGLNFAADSKGYADLMQLVKDIEEFAPVVEQAFTALEKLA